MKPSSVTSQEVSGLQALVLKREFNYPDTGKAMQWCTRSLGDFQGALTTSS